MRNVESCQVLQKGHWKSLTITNQTGADSLPIIRPRSAASVRESRVGAAAGCAVAFTAALTAAAFAALSAAFAALLAAALPFEQAITAETSAIDRRGNRCLARGRFRGE